MMKALVFAAGLSAAALLGAAPAQASPGLSIDLNGDGTSFDIGTGATTTQSGNAHNNPSLAISIFGDASTEATGNANNNVLIAVDGQVKVGGNASGNVITNVGSKTERNGQGKDPGVVSLTVCGTQFSGQGKVTVNPLQGGLC